MSEVCKGYDKEVVDGYPVKLYHATTDIYSVCNNGLKPACEVEDACGLGGSDNFLYFTRKKEIADVIADELENSIDIAKEEYDWDSIVTYLVHSQNYLPNTSMLGNQKRIPRDVPRDDWSKYIWNEAIKNSQERRESPFVKLPKGEVFEELKNGWISYTERFGDTIEQFENRASKEYDQKVECKPSPNPNKNLAHPKLKSDDSFSDALCYMPDKSQHLLWKFYRLDYLNERARYGGIMNPVFWSNNTYSDFKNMKKLDTATVGVVEVDGYFPHPMEKYLNIYKKVRNKRGDEWWRILDQAEYNMVKQNKTEKEGYYVSGEGGLEEVRLAKNRFNKLKVIRSR